MVANIAKILHNKELLTKNLIDFAKNIKMFSTRSIMPHENPYLQGVLSLVSLLTGGVSLTLSCKEND